MMMLENRVESGKNATDEALIFLHVPKTAGISVSQSIVGNFTDAEVYHVRNPDHVNGPVFSKNHGTIESFRRLPEAQRRRFRCILGHMHFGLHEQVPGPAGYVTVLRDPVERLLSHFGQYSRMVQSGEIGEDVALPSFEEFCRLKVRAMDNHQTRFLCGQKFDKHSRQDNLDRAKENLRKWFRVVGTLERFDETDAVLHRAYGWPQVARFRENVGTGRLRREEVDPKFLAEVEELNWVDRELHGLANSLLDAAIAKYGPLSGPEEPREERREERPRKPFFLRRALNNVLGRS
ncbi:MAG: sulfotransferase family 2 domain-containing protein [Planctomycetes bacterium]|nr:sulfotransferase family 2 domain-containing protein [Planctomycetota bacterium]